MVSFVRPRFFVACFAWTLGAILSLGLACGGDPVGGDCTVRVTCMSSDCTTAVRENACICPEGSKTKDQCAKPPLSSSDAGRDGAALVQDAGGDSASTSDSSSDSPSADASDASAE